MFRLAGVIVAAVVLSIDSGSAQVPSLRGGLVVTPNVEHEVTISRGGTLLASLRLPAGIAINASYDETRPHSIEPERWEFHGDFMLGVELASELPPQGVGIFRKMAEAPIFIAVRDMEVVIRKSN
jgi:hypothetical protein